MRLSAQLQEKGYGLEVSEVARNLIAEEGYDPVYGARPLKRVIQQRLQNALANEILSGEFAEGSTLRVDAAADGFIFTADPTPETQSA